MPDTTSIPIREWIDTFMPVGRFGLILLCAWIARKLIVALIRRLEARNVIPTELVRGLRRVTTFLITTTALVVVLDTLGVSATMLWTVFTGFVAVGAVAFFAAWSVLSNVFCTFLIFTTRPFRLFDKIELLEGGDKPGLCGEVIDVNLIYTTLKEATSDGQPGSVLQVPNSLFFQRVLRRWERRG